MKIGITGHQKLDNPAWVKQEISNILRLQPLPMVGTTSLAIGADQLFAQAVLDSAGTLYVIVPFDGYDKVFEGKGLEEYKRLLSSASTVEMLEITSSHEEAFLAAGKKVVDVSELLIAVWNGKPAVGLGGTADIVEYARHQQKPFIHINPVSEKIAFSL